MHPEPEVKTLGQHVASFKGGLDVVRDRLAFLGRCQNKAAATELAGLPMLGLGGSCGKPAFQLPFVVRFDEQKLVELERTAERFGMFVEYGAYPHLKLVDGGQEIAAVQDWTTLTLVFMRPSYARKEALIEAIQAALA